MLQSQSILSYNHKFYYPGKSGVADCYLYSLVDPIAPDATAYYLMGILRCVWLSNSQANNGILHFYFKAESC